MKRLISLVVIIFIMISGLKLSASATSSDSFTRSDQPGGNISTSFSREAYTAVCTITATSLGLDKPLEGLTDICVGEDGIVYILCGETSRIIKLNSDYTFKNEITAINEKGVQVSFSGAQGIFVDISGNIYIADTKNGRVIVADANGRVQKFWKLPESKLIPEGFLYQPTSIAKDDKGFTYILSLGCFYGALTYSPEGNFLGFSGSNMVNASALDTLMFLWDKLTSNDVKKSQSIKKLPYSFVDLSIDTDGYMVTCTGMTEEGNGTGQIRKVSPGGLDILYKRNPEGITTSSSLVNFLENRVIRRNGQLRRQNIVSIDTDSDGFIYALDKTYGYIYVYDSECNLINGFGGGVGTGNQLGVFNTPVSLMVNGTSVLVADAENFSVTVFNITNYGTLLKKAHSMYIKGDYDTAKPIWKQVLSLDRGNQMAYRGLAIVSYNEGDYKTALDYAKSGLDYTVYDLAWQAIVSDFMAENFVFIFLGVIILIGGLIALFVVFKKRKIVLVANDKLKTLCCVPFHPFRSFDDLKYKKQGSLILAVILSALLYIAFTLQEIVSGFLFIDTSPQHYNIFLTIAKTIGFVLLWSVSSWLIGSLFSGKGKFVEVFTATTYSLLPLIIFTFFRTVLSHFIPLSGSAFLSELGIAVWVFTIFLLCIAMMTVHEYNFFEFALTCLVIVFFMILVVFFLLLLGTLLQQLWNFIYSIYEEIVYR